MDRPGLIAEFASFPARLAAVAIEAATRRQRAGEWGPTEVGRHLVSVEREVWQARLVSLEGEVEPAWSWTEPGRAPELDGASLDAVLENFAAERLATVDRIRGLTEADWRRSGVHANYGRLDVESLLRVALDHDAEHLRGLA